VGAGNSTSPGHQNSGTGKRCPPEPQMNTAIPRPHFSLFPLHPVSTFFSNLNMKLFPPSHSESQPPKFSNRVSPTPRIEQGWGRNSATPSVVQTSLASAHWDLELWAICCTSRCHELPFCCASHVDVGAGPAFDEVFDEEWHVMTNWMTLRPEESL